MPMDADRTPPRSSSAKARGEVAADIDAALVADLVASYAWKHLLTNRLDEEEVTIRATVRYVISGISR